MQKRIMTNVEKDLLIGLASTMLLWSLIIGSGHWYDLLATVATGLLLGFVYSMPAQVPRQRLWSALMTLYTLAFAIGVICWNVILILLA